ncbi:MAG TPA: hypothetical protein VFT69_16970 [Pseudolabrys sp.]|nr:hypothetical protein [Pseudolabrys sp.]
MIIEDGQPMDGEIYLTRAEVMNASQYADVGARIVEFAVPGRGGRAVMSDVTAAIVSEACDAGIYDDVEHARHSLPGEFIDFPLSRSEVAEARAERRLEEARDHQAMGWL